MRKQKDYAWLLMLIIVLIAILAASCQSKSGHYLENKKKDSIMNQSMYSYERLNRFLVGNTSSSNIIVIEYKPENLIGFKRNDTLFVSFKPNIGF